MKNGRPSKLTPELIKKAETYIASCVDKFEIDMSTKKILNIGVNLPKMEGLASYLGVSRRVLYNWGEINKDFMHILEAVNQEQVKRLIDGGLSGKYNATIAKLVLAKHGYKEESTVEHLGKVVILDVKC
jgi:hypothetical protein